MRRHLMSERPDWRVKAERYGFPFHSVGGQVYWDETVAWSFSLDEIEQQLEEPTAELEQMCLAFVDRAVSDDGILRRFAIPETQWGLIRDSWSQGHRNLYGRFDLAYDGTGPAKLLEYNADTPTSLFEAAVFQWTWLEDKLAAGKLPAGSDQFNSLHERLVEAFRNIRPGGSSFLLHLACVMDSAEDAATVAYLADCARQAGLQTELINIGDIGVTASGQLTDLQDRAIGALFKLYPWEWLVAEEFARHLPTTRTQFIEPPWKALLSSKALLPYLWEMAEGHPNLLPTFFADDPRVSSLGEHVIKPLHSREGANIQIVRHGQTIEQTDGDYAQNAKVVQALAPLARFESAAGAGHAVIGSWVVASQPAGIGIREGVGMITRDNARFVPHWIEA
jgi:glutathionylspermidine synthase